MKFAVYTLIGCCNTAIHWSIFYGLYALAIGQSFANLIAYLIAATFSYVVNARYNFQTTASINNFIKFLVLMGSLNLCIGYVAGRLNWLPIYTLMTSSTLSLFIGYTLSKRLIFKNN